EWAVYRILCRMLKDPEILAKVEEIRVNVGITPELSNDSQTEIDKIIEEASNYVNSEIQKAVKDISQKAMDRIKSKINELHSA
ncbi:hypothetical protein, partial [Viridibacillus arvi]|uniref:hypothetical protein n=1 Tax=Viridibacillus arvi TaxID=263475 RepID=UPI003CFDECA6